MRRPRKWVNSKSIKAIQRELQDFATQRDWEQFHTPKNLATALVCEAAELAELFQWLTPEQSWSCMTDEKSAASVCDEIADIQIYLLRLADKLNVDIDKAVSGKIRINAEKYPVDKVRGNAVKYSRRET